MKWLHFSDFHIRKIPGAQAEAMSGLVEYIRRQLILANSSIDAVFLVGDIAYSGADEEYRRFEESFLGPLRELPQLANAKIFAVPGNHDVDVILP